MFVNALPCFLLTSCLSTPCLALSVDVIFVNAVPCLLSVHVMFDDSFELDDRMDRFVPNIFVRQLIECMEDAAR